jgi:hypothetical protein
MTISDSEHFETSSEKPCGRGMAKKSLSLIATMVEIIEAAQPITGRGVGYKLFVRKLIKSMSTNDMQKVYGLLKEAREKGMIPWEWIVDESRQLEKNASWDDPDAFTRSMINSYRREYWNQQPVRVEVWSEKGTVRGVLQPVLDEYGVGFRVVHGFASATVVHDIAEDDDGRELIILYVGDWDPSGLCMSEHDLPERLKRYDGEHVVLQRISLTQDQLAGLPGFPAKEKSKDKRYKWFIKNYGASQGVPDDKVECWELDALDPNILRDCVREAIKEEIEWDAWERCKITEAAEQASLQTVMKSWNQGKQQPWGCLV